MAKTTHSPGTYEHEIRHKIQSLVANNYPDCSAAFVGSPQGNRRRRTFGFRIVDAKGKYRTETIWVGPSFYSRPNKTWLLREVARAKWDARRGQSDTMKVSALSGTDLSK